MPISRPKEPGTDRPTARKTIVAATGKLILNALIAWLLVVAGECLFRGPAPTLEWLKALPVASVVAASYLLLWMLALQSIASRYVAWLLCGATVVLFATANTVKMAKLGAPVTPNDLLLAQQLLPTARMLWGWMAPAALFGILLITASAIWFNRHRLRHQGHIGYGRIVGGIACAAIAVWLVTAPDYSFKNARFRSSAVAEELDRLGIHNINWSSLTNVSQNGQLLSFLMNLQPALVVAPAGYDEQRIDTILHTNSQATLATQELPQQAQDVVVIMNEAWWDPRKLPGVHFTDALQGSLDISAAGEIFSPTFGGYTANTEFEFLSRLSNAFLPAGSVPYREYINRPIASLATDFAAAGFETTAIHPFDGAFWNRSNVYPRMGFSRFLTEADFIDPDRVPPYISDHALAKRIISTIDSALSKHHFVFAVSMQNHGPYGPSAERYAQEGAVGVDAPALSPQARDILSTYASGVRDAVSAFNEVVAYFREHQRPAVVVMFGDHLPFLGDNYDLYVQTQYLQSANQAEWSAQDRRDMHATPVVAWSNLPQGIELATTPQSPVFLASTVKLAAGLQLSAMDALLQRIKEQVPVLTQFYSEDADGKPFSSPPHGDLLDDYRLLTYDELFGMGYSVGYLRDGHGQLANVTASPDSSPIEQ